jgi:hypothetical protein
MLVADWMEPGQRQISPWNTILYVHTGLGAFIYLLANVAQIILSVRLTIHFVYDSLSLVRSFFSLPFMWLYNYMRALVDIYAKKILFAISQDVVWGKKSYIFLSIF